MAHIDFPPPRRKDMLERLQAGRRADALLSAVSERAGAPRRGPAGDARGARARHHLRHRPRHGRLRLRLDPPDARGGLSARRDQQRRAHPLRARPRLRSPALHVQADVPGHAAGRGDPRRDRAPGRGAQAARPRHARSGCGRRCGDPEPGLGRLRLRRRAGRADRRRSPARGGDASCSAAGSGPSTTRPDEPELRALYTYPWDLADEGLETALGRIRPTGVNTITLAASYHAGKFVRPHGVGGKVYFPKDGTVYFQARPERYGQIKPLVNPLVEEFDALAQLARSGAGSGPGRLGRLLPQHAARRAASRVHARNAFGDPYPYSLCPAHPAVRDYVVNLCADLANRYDLAGLALETPGWLPFDHGFHHEFALVPLDRWAKTLLGALLRRGDAPRGPAPPASMPIACRPGPASPARALLRGRSRGAGRASRPSGGSPTS